jgi:hypothetical protein
LHPSVIERFIVSATAEVSAATRRTLRTNFALGGRAGGAGSIVVVLGCHCTSRSAPLVSGTPLVHPPPNTVLRHGQGSR